MHLAIFYVLNFGPTCNDDSTSEPYIQNLFFLSKFNIDYRSRLLSTTNTGNLRSREAYTETRKPTIVTEIGHVIQ